MAVRVEGLREVVRGFNRSARATKREFQLELKKVAEPVAAAGREKISRYQGASVGTIVPRAQGVTSVFVTQKARKKTGLRPDFGGVQQRRLDEALNENEDVIERGFGEAADRIVALF